MEMSRKERDLIALLLEDHLTGVRFQSRSARRMLSLQSEEAPVRQGWIEKARQAQELENMLESLVERLRAKE